MRSQDSSDSRGSGSGLITPRRDATSSARVEFTVDRPSFQQLVAEPTLCAVDRICHSLDQANYDDAAIRALARLELGLDVPSEALLEVLVGLDTRNITVFIALARNVATKVMLERLRCGHFGDNSSELDRTILAACVVWLSNPTDEMRAQIVPLLRRAARWHHMPLVACAFLGWLVVQVDDQHLREIFQARHGAADTPLARLLGDQVREMRFAPLDQLVAGLPSTTNDPVLKVASVVAPLRKVGRNEPCPCGSGSKYKRCHADRPEEITPPLPSRAEVFKAISSRLSPEDIPRLSRSAVAALDVSLVRSTTLPFVLQSFAYSRDWQRARRARDEIARRYGRAEADSRWCFVVYEAIRARQFDVARELFAELQNPSDAKDLEFELELHELGARNREIFAPLERAAETALRRGTPGGGALARAVLHTMPALGILVARGAQPDICDADPDELRGFLNEIEDARNTLGMAPNDPAWGIYGLTEESEDNDDQDDQAPERDDREREGMAKVAADLQAKLDQTTGRLNDLQRQLAEQSRAAAVERPAPLTPAATPAPDAEQRARQKQRIEELEGLVREGNTERGALRRALSELTRRSASPATPAGNRREDADTHEDQFADVVEPAGGRRVLVPAFSAIAETALAEVPREVAAATVVAVGRLAAGESGVWRRIKQAKGTTLQVLMARIGIHHRLLFRADGGRLEMLDLVTRESLQTVLKRLRAM